ncbi:MAG: YeeE/YedE family protein [Betaproteobacteria bacterium]|nr:YeeE/YedE family protein [Betaproteobacteria bacterium]MDE2122209.1 YeeE/YedE family protein [Betaproteobacteria bacterium]MDE2187062.1 YeeE/YedE family protein [Betaproteobacteria bacterium]MDE2325493.1 YeeE/YedE family protein [Betaproteobacteria bacterium]
MDWIAHWFPLGWIHFLGGGVAIGLGVSLLFCLTGFIGGASTVYSAVWSYFSQWPHFQHPKFVSTRHWRLAYALGMIIGAVVFTFAVNRGEGFVTRVPAWQLLAGGVVGGFGARMGGGCTSGHGICGLGSLQLPSLLAVITFLVTAIVTAHIVRAYGGF